MRSLMMALLMIALVVNVVLSQEQVQRPVDEPYDEWQESPTVELAGRHYPAVRVFVDGQETDSRGFIRRGRTFMPARETLERLGGMVSWTPAEQAFYARFADLTRTVRVAVGSREVIVYEHDTDRQFGAGAVIRRVNLRVAPFLAEGRVFAPVRAAADAVGAKVHFDSETRIVYVTSTPGARQ